MAWQSTLPTALDALVSMLRADLGSIVWDGPEVRDAAALEAVFVGHTGGDEGTAASGAMSQPGLALQPDREQYAISCAASVLNGASDITAARNRAYELLAAVGAVLTANHTLGGVVMSAQLGEWSLEQQQIQELGAYASITFDVDVEAFTHL